MFEVKVKTLDGRNTSFTVEDEITVAEFKAKISEGVNIGADRQRLIFTGKVLNDNNKLKSYNVEDKVIHVVNRAPPTPGSNSASNTPPLSTNSRGNHNRPSVSMSSVPSNMLGDVMNSVISGLPGDAVVHHVDLRRTTTTQRSQFTESGRRVVLIRQWIRDSHSLLDRIRNPSQGTRLTAESQTAEARNVSQQLPHIQGESISVSVSTSGVPTTLPTPSAAAAPAAAAATPRTNLGQATTRTSTTINQSPAVGATQGERGQPSRGEDTPSTPTVNPHVEVLSSLWGEVEALNVRLHPHMHRYRELLANPGMGCPGHNQHLFDTISSVTHNLSHIYHGISDLTCDFSPMALRELTASAAPTPPPTAIIQQTIPVTIPLRATLNMSPRTTRRSAVQSPSATSTTTSSAARAQAGQASYTPTTSAAMVMGTSGEREMFTSIELDMETDSGEEMSEDGHASELGQAGAGQTATGQPSGQPSTSIPDPLRNFNLSQILQDAFSGMAGMGGLSGGGANTTTVSGASAGVSSGATPAAANIASGSFGQFIPPAGAATTSNGPLLPGATSLPGGVAGFPPGIPASAMPPGWSLGGHQTPRDRQDPYLSTCSSKHWSAPQPNRHGHRHQAAAGDTQQQPHATPTTSTVNRGTTATPTAQGNSQTANSSNNQRQTSSTNGVGSSPLRSASNTSISANTASDASSMGSSSLVTAETAERIRFFEEIRGYVVEGVRELGHSELRVPLPASDLNRLIQRVEDMFKKASDNVRPAITIAELDRTVEEATSAASESSTSLGLLGELCTLLFKDFTIADLYRVYTMQGRHFDRLRGPLRRFSRSSVLQDGPNTPENMAAAADRLLVSIRDQLHGCLSDMRDVHSSSYDIESSLCSFIKSWLLDILNFITTSKEGTEQYGNQLLCKISQGMTHLVRLAHELFKGCTSSPADSWTHVHLIVIKLIEHCTSSRRLLGHTLSRFATNHMQGEEYTNHVLSIPITSLAGHMITSEQSTASAMHTDEPSSVSSDYQDAELDTTRNNNNGQGSSSTSAVSPSPISPSTLSEASAADWRTVIPADWVAIIEEDIKRQLRLEANSEDLPALSDTYLNGRPQKRRRLSEAGEEQD